MREDLLAAIPGIVEALTHFLAVLSPILQTKAILLSLEHIYAYKSKWSIIRPKMINMIINKLLPKNMCIERK